MALTNELYGYRRMPKPAITAPAKLLTGEANGFQSAPRHIAMSELEAHLIQIAQEALQQAAADRVLCFTSAPLTSDANGNNAAARSNNNGIGFLEFDLPRAFRCFHKAVEADPHLAPAWNNLGLVYLQIGQINQANEYFQKAILYDETSDTARGNAAMAALEAGDYETANQRLSQAIELDPNNPIHYNSLGILYLTLGFTEEAINCFNQAIQLNPNLPMPYHNRGRAYLQLEDYPRANRDIDQANRIESAATELPCQEL